MEKVEEGEEGKEIEEGEEVEVVVVPGTNHTTQWRMQNFAVFYCREEEAHPR